MEEKLEGTVENLEKVIERWLEYGMKLPVTHENAVNLAPVCVNALEEVNSYRMDTPIKLPDNVHVTRIDTGERTNVCPAYAIVYRFQLTDWLKEDWKNPENKKTNSPNSE